MRISDWSSDVCSSDLYGHKQVFNTVVQTEGTGAHGTLHVRIKPSRDSSQQGGIYKDNDLVAPHVYAKGFGHAAAAFQCEYGAARPRIKQIAGSQPGQPAECPYKVKIGSESCREQVRR